MFATLSLGLRVGVAQKKRVSVTTLEHDEKSSYYKERWTFDTEEEALEFVRSLIPNLFRVDLHKGTVDEVRTGYLEAARYMVNDPVKYYWNIVDRRTGLPHWVSDFPLWDFNRAWAVLENIRVDGKPVSRSEGEYAICEYISQPIIVKNAEIIYV